MIVHDENAPSVTNVSTEKASSNSSLERMRTLDSILISFPVESFSGTV
jgi:hypothetical protein